MRDILRNWKTSILGGGFLTGAVITFAENPDNWRTALLQAGAGLIGLFAKDNNVSGK